MDNIFKDVFKDCKDNNFHIFEYWCELEIKFVRHHLMKYAILQTLTVINYSHANSPGYTKNIVNTKKMETNQWNDKTNNRNEFKPVKDKLFTISKFTYIKIAYKIS